MKQSKCSGRHRKQLTHDDYILELAHGCTLEFIQLYVVVVLESAYGYVLKLAHG